MIPDIKFYGTAICHKTQYYKKYLEDLNLEYSYLDVELNTVSAEELRSLYETRKLNFPTIITIGEKIVRNPSDKDLNKWIEKLI
jgi:arsenate reductase-like glutaredoxin family protein